MAGYSDKYALTFEENIKEFATNKKIKEMLKKAISFILDKPYYRADKVEKYSGKTIFRKNICAGRLRIFYQVNEENKTVKFYFIRKKDKRTYKNL